VLLAVPVVGAASERLVELRDGKLTVRLEKVPVVEVLSEVARASGAEIRGVPLDEQDVTIAFEGLPLDEGLRRLLPGQPFALKYKGDRLAAVELLDQSGAVLAGGTPKAPRAQPEEGNTAHERALSAYRTSLGVARMYGGVVTYGPSEEIPAAAKEGAQP
jgi:hypothetical protein